MTHSNTHTLALVGGTVHPSPTDEPIRDGVVLVDGGTIAAVGGRTQVALPDGVPSLDCAGLTITAGFWNCHVHLFERKWADAAAIPAPELLRQLEDTFTRYGFSSVFDLSSSWSNTRRLLDDGVDGIKLFLRAAAPGGPPFAEGGIEAATAEAQRAGRPVFVHPANGSDVRAAASAGVDVIGHTTPHSGPWDEPTLAAMTRGGVALTPTLTLWRYFLRHDGASTRDLIVGTALGQLRAWHKASGTVLFGTDLGAVDPDPGEEYALMAEAGMDFGAILASLTTAPAARFGEPLLGRVAAGFQADLVALAGDPSRNIRGLAEVRYPLREGKVIHRAATNVPPDR